MQRYLLIAPLLAGLFHGITWFAGPIILMVLLTPFFAVHDVVPYAAFFGMLINALMIIVQKPSYNRPLLKTLFIPTLLWVPVWILLLKQFDAATTKKIIWGLILIFLCIQNNNILRTRVAKQGTPILAWIWWIVWSAYNINGPVLAMRMMSKWIDKNKDAALHISTVYFFLFGFIFVIAHLISWRGTFILWSWYNHLLFFGSALSATLVGYLLWKTIENKHYHLLLQLFLGMSALLFLV